MKYIYPLFVLILLGCSQNYKPVTTHYLGSIDTSTFSAGFGLNINKQNVITNGYVCTGYPFPIQNIKAFKDHIKFECPYGVIGKALSFSYKVSISNSETPTFKNAIIEVLNLSPPVKFKIELIPSFTTNQSSGTINATR